MDNLVISSESDNISDLTDDEVEDKSLYTYYPETVNHPTFSSILEIDNVSRGTYRVSAVAYKSAPLMMTYFQHKTLTILLDTGAEIT